MTTEKRHQKSITQRLRTDLGRPVGVTTSIQLVWLTGLQAEPSHSPQQPCNQKDTHVKFIIEVYWERCSLYYRYVDNKHMWNLPQLVS